MKIKALLKPITFCGLMFLSVSATLTAQPFYNLPVELPAQSAPSLAPSFYDLPVTLYGQKGRELCWAASIEMILKFHNPGLSITQCDLANLYFQLRNESSSGLPSCFNICTEPCGQVVSEDCSLNFDYGLESFSGSEGAARPQYFDIFFSRYGLQSNEVLQLLTWDGIIKEVTNCRPFIMIYSASGVGVGAHAVVGKGYYQPVADSKYVIVNDPWDICTGCEYLLNASIFETPNDQSQCNGITIHQVIGMVHHIMPPDKECLSCTDQKPRTKVEENSLVYKVEQNKNVFAATRFGSSIPLKDYEDYLKDAPNHHQTPVFYLSNNKLLNLSGEQSNFNNLTIKGDFSLLGFGKEKTTLTAELTKLERCYYVRKISDCSVDAEDIVISTFGNDTIYLSNKYKQYKGKETTPFSLVRYAEYDLAFAKFTYKGMELWRPNMGKSISSKPPFKGIKAEKEKIVLGKLRIYSKGNKLSIPFINDKIKSLLRG